MAKASIIKEQAEATATDTVVVVEVPKVEQGTVVIVRGPGIKQDGPILSRYPLPNGTVVERR